MLGAFIQHHYYSCSSKDITSHCVGSVQTFSANLQRTYAYMCEINMIQCCPFICDICSKNGLTWYEWSNIKQVYSISCIREIFITTCTLYIDPVWYLNKRVLPVIARYCIITKQLMTFVEVNMFACRWKSN